MADIDHLAKDAVTARAMVGLVAAITAIDVLVTRLEPPHSDLAVKGAILVGLLVWARRGVGLTWDELGFGRSHVRDGVRLGVAALLLIGTAIFVLVAVPVTRAHFDDHHVAAAATTERVVQPLVMIPLGTVVFEETIFRGVLLGVLLRGRTRMRAGMITSVVFGLWHIPPALSDAQGKSVAAAVGIVAGTVAVTSVAGAAFAYLRLRSGSVLAPMLAHTATNSLAYVGAIVALQL